MEVTVVGVPDLLVVGMRKRGAYAEIARMIPAVCEYAASKEVQLIGPPMFLCHEKSKEEAMEAQRNGNADVEVAVPVSSKGEESDEIKFYKLPGGKMARVVHKGPYERCEAAYDKVFAWIRDNKRKVVGPSREVYMNDPREIPPEEIITEIHVPIE